MRVMLTASVPVELAEGLRAHAREADRSVSAELRCAIRSHLARGRNDDGASGQAPRVTTPAGGDGRHVGG